MQPHPRYDIIAQIATGDFATVFRARDKELARDVAIKQIHPQFLTDPRQLNRYWDEAQIIASLEHPNVLTIYDIDRQRGWLILELMVDTMQSRAAGKPMDLELIRMGLVCGLKALEFLHKKNIVHGDVKPSNLLIDSRNWIKLGDFGLAQRAADDQGSLFKGTTRYIAPERVDPEIFGPVGPHSDLYSLGFSMYELLCGNAFESLFPGLKAFGSDKQIAWMMWHAGPDRKMPPINRVLKGVPEDLAQVIEKLVTKDPKHRYRDAQEAIRDLKIGMGKGGIGPTEAEKAEAEAIALEEAKKKRRKNLLIAAVTSMAACILLLLLIPTPEPPKPVKKLVGVDGRLIQIVSSDTASDSTEHSDGNSTGNTNSYVGKLVVDTIKDKVDQTVIIRQFDQVYLNDSRINIASDAFDLTTFEKEDHVHTEWDSDKSTGQQIQIIHVTRPIQETGIITDVQPETNAFVFSAKRDGRESKGFLVRIPKSILIEVNDKQLDTTQGNPIKLLQPQDLATFRHNVYLNEKERPQGRIVAPKTTIRIIRKLVTRGTLQNADVTQQSIDIKTTGGDTVQLSLRNDCKVFLNGRNLVGDRRFTLADLNYGDRVTVRHDTDAVRIDAERTSKAKGTVTKVIPAARKVIISLQDKGSPSLTFTIPKNVIPTLDGTPITLSELQPTDLANLTYDATDPQSLIISKLSVQRIADRKRWALVVGFDSYADKTLSPVPHLGKGTVNVINTLIDRYRVPKDQTLLVQNVVRAELKSKITNFLRRLRGDSELIVYYAGHAYLDAYKQPQLATKNFKLLDTAKSGLPLKWLIDAIEECQANEKILFLDTCHEGSGNDLKDQPSSDQMVMILEKDRTQPALKSVHVIASCRSGERGQRSDSGGYFSNAIISAYQGNADRDHNQRVTLGEVNNFIRDLVSKESQGGQSTSLIKPGKIVAPRISDALLTQMKDLSKTLQRQRVTTSEIADEINYLRINGGSEPEPVILTGLAALKTGKWQAARRILEGEASHLIAQQGIIWAYYQQRDYEDAINTLIALIQTASETLNKNESKEQTVEAERILEWAGRLREYAETATIEKDKISEINAETIDDAAEAAGSLANRRYTNGRNYVADKVEDFNDAISKATNKAAKLTIRNKKIKLKNYASFNFPLAIAKTLQSAENKK